jgi:hypothetical protein
MKTKLVIFSKFFFPVKPGMQAPGSGVGNSIDKAKA